MKRVYLSNLVMLVALLVGYSMAALAQTSTFNYTGSVQTYTVPAGVTSLGIDAKGGCGGGAYVSFGSSGPVSLGGRVVCTLNVTPGDVLNIYVGQGASLISAGSNNPGGWNGGGQGGTYANAGGGASDIRLGGTALANRVVVAGAGGGGGDFGPAGGVGGGLTGGAGGGGGACGGGPSGPSCSTGTNLGLLGQGSPVSTTAYSLGGGGGGLWGGNQGVTNYGGGGGGSSYTSPTLCTGVVHTQAYTGANGNGQILITQLCINPAANTGGSAILCSGLTTTFANVGTTGTWVSSNPSLATVGATTGVVTGVAAGAVTISYLIPGGCYAASAMTINTGPTISGISTNSPFCSNAGTALTLTATSPLSVSSYAWTGPTGVTGATTASGSVPAATPAASGIYTLTLTSTSGCVSTYTTSVTVNLGPTPISGSLNACMGTNSTLGNTVAGGTWTSSIAGVATINPSSGLLTPAAVGTTIVSYALSNGCSVNNAATVNALPTLTIAPSSSATTCLGNGVAFSASAPGATFSWTGLAGATGLSCSTCGAPVITPTATDVNSYNVTATSSVGCNTTSTVTLNVNPVPSPITGLTSLCVGTTGALSSSTGGTWSSSDPSKASIGSTTGLISGVGVGTANISYTLSTGCKSTVIATVNTAPANIGGNTSVCIGSTTTLTHIVGGGTWLSSNSATASVNALGGVTGVAAGPVTITYTLPSGCTTTLPMVVNPLPAPITGNTAICQATTSTLSSTTTGGTWLSNGPAIASVNAFGAVTGLVPGFANITYTLPTGCMTSVPVTVNITPSAITGTPTVCFSSQTALGNPTAGGAWTSSNTGIATVNTTGVVTGIAAGNATITYSFSTGCKATQNIVVNPLPAVISGNLEVCQGATTALSDIDAGGTWTSSFPATASVDATGTVTGNGSGNATITYTLSTGCKRTASVTVDPLPNAITGTASVCQGGTTTLSNSTSGGTWGSASAAAGVDGAGVVSGYTPGFASIIYTLPSGCSRSATVTVNALPAAITGTMGLCVGATTSLNTAATGGAWTSNNYSIAAIDGSGTVTGAGAGIALITYTLPTGCNTMTTVTVNALPANISGTTSVCEGATSALHNATSGGTWSSESPIIAVVSPTGVVIGSNAGNSMITYTLATGCYKTRNMTVNPAPATIGGILNVCAGLTTSLSNSVTGGAWTSSFSGIATIDASGLVSGQVAGTTNITYTLPQGCNTSVQVTVNPLPADISGNMNVCQNSSVTLSSTTLGGSWSNAGTGVTNVSTTGVVTGNLPGSENITYTMPTGCIKTANVVVNPIPAPISGDLFACKGLTSTLTNATTGGTWSSSSSATATVNTAGVVTGVNTGVTTITYKLPTNCASTSTFIVNAVPAAITGNAAVCPGTSSTLSDVNTGGSWMTNDAAIAMIDASGTLTGVGAGTTMVTYTLATGCTAAKIATVNPAPAAISGNSNVCQSTATGLSDPSSGGAWSSSAAGVATINASGVVIGLTPGNAIITYTLPTGCYATKPMVVNAVPGPITGTAAVCSGGMSTLNNATPGGVWGTPSANATITLAGNVTGVHAGTAVISYLMSTGCVRTKVVTVNAQPAAIAGTSQVCPGTTTTLSDDVTGGSWSSHQPLTATVDATGMVTGVAAGITTITYTLPTGCYATKTTTVNSGVAAIAGNTSICNGTTSSLTTMTTGGAWISSNTTIATIGAISGTVSGVTPGAAIMTYSLPNGCLATFNLNVNPAPSAILGTGSICVGATTVLTNSEPGGAWSSSNPGNAAVNAAGTVTAITAGTTMITYALPSGCSSTSLFVANGMPAPNAVNGGGNFCAGGAGVSIGTDGSSLGNTYKLYLGSALVATMTGTGGTVDFGTFNTAGIYTLTATTAAGCKANMAGSATVAIIPNVIPAAFLASSMGDSICAGNAAMFSSTAVNGGTAPAFSWSVNGAPVGGSSSYTYTPADGDLISVTITGNALCATTATASAGMTLHVIPTLTPAVTTAAVPGVTLCKGIPATYTATAANGGSSPEYAWYKNNFMYAEGTSFTYTPQDGDQIYCVMTSNYRCPSTNSVHSSTITMTVNNIYIPDVQVIANPGTTVAQGQTVNFTLSVANAGPAPLYQWKVKGVAVAGATSATFSGSHFNEGDSVTCDVTGSGACGVRSRGGVQMHVTTGVAHTSNNNSDIRLIPNPNNGTFTINGTLASANNEEIMIEVTDMLGQIVYKNKVMSNGSSINEQVQLNSNLANGMYLLNMNTASEHQAFSFMIAR